MAAVTICSDFGAQENKVSHCFHCFLIYLPWSDGTRCWILEWVPTHSLQGIFLTQGLNLGPLLCRQIVYLKVHIVKAVIFPVVMYGCESWTIKKVECWRIDAFQLWYWRRLFRVSRTARRYNQSILKEINPEYSLERLTLKLKLQYFGHPMQRTDSLEKTLILGKIEGSRKGQQRTRW